VIGRRLQQLILIVASWTSIRHSDQRRRRSLVNSVSPFIYVNAYTHIVMTGSGAGTPGNVPPSRSGLVHLSKALIENCRCTWIEYWSCSPSKICTTRAIRVCSSYSAAWWLYGQNYVSKTKSLEHFRRLR